LARWQQLRDREETETPGARTLAKAILKGMAAVINATRNAA